MGDVVGGYPDARRGTSSNPPTAAETWKNWPPRRFLYEGVAHVRSTRPGAGAGCLRRVSKLAVPLLAGVFAGALIAVEPSTRSACRSWLPAPGSKWPPDATPPTPSSAPFTVRRAAGELSATCSPWRAEQRWAPPRRTVRRVVDGFTGQARCCRRTARERSAARRARAMKVAIYLQARIGERRPKNTCPATHACCARTAGSCWTRDRGDNGRASTVGGISYEGPDRALQQLRFVLCRQRFGNVVRRR